VGAADTAYVTLTDSAGVRIVTNLPGSIAAAQAWRLGERPVLEIGGGASPAVPLHRVTAVRPIEGGPILVGTDAPPRALVLRADGSLAATLGRQGEGPGEFDNVASVVPLGTDSVAVWDRDRRRLSVFTLDGVFQREVELSGLVPLSPLAAPNAEVPAGFTRLLGGGRGPLVIHVNGVWGPGLAEAGAQRVALASHRIDPDGAPRATYGPFPGKEIYRSPEMGVLPFPFGATTDAALAGERLVVGTAASPQLRYFAPDGTLMGIVRWPDHERIVADGPLVAEFDAWFEEQLAWREPGEQTLFRELIGSIPRPERFPAYQGVVSGQDGRIWVGDYPGQLGLMGISPDLRRTPARQWLIIDDAGALVARLRTPEGFDPHAVRDGRVWGVYRDALDVESVRAYAVVKP
ncbi:MAG: hypothetical protein WEB88_03295, partial [Gemmatimonadota bacterium]